MTDDDVVRVAVGATRVGDCLVAHGAHQVHARLRLDLLLDATELVVALLL
jgi:hypothetical protein